MVAGSGGAFTWLKLLGLAALPLRESLGWNAGEGTAASLRPGLPAEPKFDELSATMAILCQHCIPIPFTNISHPNSYCRIHACHSSLVTRSHTYFSTTTYALVCLTSMLKSCDRLSIVGSLVDIGPDSHTLTVNAHHQFTVTDELAAVVVYNE